jgi:photosystem II stability/assembly factor-like uncharacterized protein
MLRIQWMFWLPLLLVIVGCAEPKATVVPSPTQATTVSTTNTATPAATVLPSPTSSPAFSRWQCHSSGGFACYKQLIFVSMLGPTEGWVNNLDGTVLHYVATPDSATPTWQFTPRSERIPFWTLEMVSPTEGWATWSKGVVHFKDGVWQEIPLGIGTSDLTMLDTDEGWAVTSRGLIFHYLNGEWTAVLSPTKRDLHAIAMLSPDEGWATGYGVVLHYQDKHWEEMPFTNERLYNHNFTDIEMLSSGEGWIVGSDILHYQDGTWREVTPLGLNQPLSRPGGQLRALSMVGANEGWAVGEAGTIFHYQNGQWQAIESPTQNGLSSLAMVSANEGWAVGDHSTILHYQDGRWQLVSEAAPLELRDVDWLDNGEGWAVGTPGTVMHYQNGQWQSVDTPVSGPEFNLILSAIDMTTSQEGWAVGFNGTILHYVGDTWQLVPSPGAYFLNSIDMVNEDEGWAVGSGDGPDGMVEGKIIHYVNGQWQEVTNRPKYTLTDIDMINQNEGWAIGPGGTILHYQNSTWELTEPVVTYDLLRADLLKIEMIDETTGWILGEVGRESLLLGYQNNVWQQVDHPAGDYSAMDMAGAEAGWLMGADTFLQLKDGEWQLSDNPWGLRPSGIVRLNENEGWAVGNGILHYTNK